MFTRRTRSPINRLGTLCFCASLLPLGLAGCGGGGGSGTSSGGSSSGAPKTYTISGTVSGLTGSGLVLKVNDTAIPVASGAASVALAGGLTSGTNYIVLVNNQPAGESCGIANGTGTIAADNVTNVAVSCLPITVSLLYSFQGGTTDGQEPHGNLIQAPSGTLYGVTYHGGAYTYGALFGLTTSGTETVLHSFNSPDGTTPLCGVVLGTDSNLYGTTYGGSTNLNNYYGTVYKFNPTSMAYSVMYAFLGGASDGGNSHGCLIQATDGNFYFMTNGGGPANDGAIVRITPSGTESVIHFFAGGSTDGASPYGSLTQASDGTIYGLTEAGGANNVGTIFSFNPATPNSYTTLYSFGGTNDVVQPFGSLVQASDGNLYGMAPYGGSRSNGGIFSYNPSTHAESVVYSFAGSPLDGSVPKGSLIVGKDGTLYGLTVQGGAGNLGTVFSYSIATGTETIIHQFADGPGDGATPYGDLVQGSDGNLYGMTSVGGAHSCASSGSGAPYCGAVFKVAFQ